MSTKVISSKEEVESFLHELISVLNNPNFDIDKDLDILPKKKNESPIDPYTTANTLLELDFDRKDVWHQLIALDVSEYLETFIDDKDSSWPPFFAFAKSIKNRDVYIKAKIRDRVNGKVFCVSFHFARYPFPVTLPYA